MKPDRTQSYVKNTGGRKKALGILAAVLLVAAVGVWAMTRGGGGSSADGAAPGGTAFACKTCKHQFTVATSELNAFQAKHYGERFPCPKCQSTELIRSVHCAKCGEYYPAAERGGDPPCPKCGHKPGDPT
jgi:DNA-directed RNA polymerase subunit RPC12/RpoP